MTEEKYKNFIDRFLELKAKTGLVANNMHRGKEIRPKYISSEDMEECRKTEEELKSSFQEMSYEQLKNLLGEREISTMPEFEKALGEKRQRKTYDDNR